MENGNEDQPFPRGGVPGWLWLAAERHVWAYRVTLPFWFARWHWLNHRYWRNRKARAAS